MFDSFIDIVYLLDDLRLTYLRARSVTQQKWQSGTFKASDC